MGGDDRVLVGGLDEQRSVAAAGRWAHLEMLVVGTSGRAPANRTSFVVPRGHTQSLLASVATARDLVDTSAVKEISLWRGEVTDFSASRALLLGRFWRQWAAEALRVTRTQWTSALSEKMMSMWKTMTGKKTLKE